MSLGCAIPAGDVGGQAGADGACGTGSANKRSRGSGGVIAGGPGCASGACGAGSAEVRE